MSGLETNLIMNKIQPFRIFRLRNRLLSVYAPNMKTSTLLRLWVFSLSLLLFACNPDPEIPVVQDPPISQGDMWICHQNAVWDSVATINHLIGEWEWEYIRCFWNPEDGNYDDFKGLSIDFKSDNTLDVKMDGLVTQSSAWSIEGSNENLFVIRVEPIVLQAVGQILFCDNRVEFNDSYVDGCDNYFTRK